MPRSKRRKGVKKDGRRHIDGNKIARYYDPGSAPKQPSLKALQMRGATFTPFNAHNRRGGRGQ